MVNEGAQQGQDLAAVVAVQVAGGFVGQEDQGVGDQGPGDGHALLLTAGQLGGKMSPPLVHADQLQCPDSTAPGLSGRQAGDGQGEGNILLGRQHVEEVKGLEDDADPPPAQ
jgi:acyl-CoA thioesterase-1